MLSKLLARLSGVPRSPAGAKGASLAFVAPTGRRRPVAPLPYLSKLDATLLKLTRQDNWTVRDAFAGVHVFGGIFVR